MRILYLANVGNRDVWLDGRPIPAEQSREVGEAIGQRPEDFNGRISAPILEAGLRYVLGLGSPTDLVQLTVRLFATDQDASAGSYRAKDTAQLAAALVGYLKTEFARAAGGKVSDVQIVPIRGNPSYYDDMYDLMGRQLLPKGLTPDDLDAGFVSPVGGVPAANFALLLRTVERLGVKARPLYVPEGGREAVALDIGAQLQRGWLRQLVRQEIANYEFGRAARLLREFDGRPDLALAAGLAAYAMARLHFDFQTAGAILANAVEPLARSADRELARRLRADLRELAEQRPAALIRELYFNARITYLGGRYVDFLLRLFRLREETLRRLVEEGLGLPTEAVQGKAHPDLVAKIEGDPGLLAHLHKPYNGIVLDYHRPPSTEVLRHLIDYYLAGGDDPRRQQVRALVVLLDRLRELANLRNRSIGAHGFAGVSEAEIKRHYGAQSDLLADLAEIVRLLGLDPTVDPFEEIRSFVLSRLDQER